MDLDQQDYKKLSKLFDEVINEVLEIREDRAALYGNGWADIGFTGNAWHLIGKAGRFRYMLEKDPNRVRYETVEDTLKDMINYAGFCLALKKLERLKQDERVNSR